MVSVCIKWFLFVFPFISLYINSMHYTGIVAAVWETKKVITFELKY